ncbi:MAG: DinB family protein [Chloroflexi bacterium]|nr:DinB family protein [Chloroflexota bacterium]
MLKELESITYKLNEAQTVLTRTLASVTEAQAAQTKVTDQWSVKDELAHLAGANRGMLRIAQGMARGEEPKLPAGYSNDEYNARQVAKRKNMTFKQIAEELDATHAEMIQFLGTVSLRQLELCGEHPLAGEVNLKDLLVIIYSHQTDHCKEVSAKLRKMK